MAPGPAVRAARPQVDYHQLVDPNAKWWKNSRLVKLNLWILLLYVFPVLDRQPSFSLTLAVIRQSDNLNGKWLRWKYDE